MGSKRCIVVATLAVAMLLDAVSKSPCFLGDMPGETNQITEPYVLHMANFHDTRLKGGTKITR